jgi:hypothetical protein
MYHLMRQIHPIIAALLLISYTLLAWRWWTLKETKLSPLYRTLAHTSRFLLLVLYMDGLLLSNVFRLPVSEWHHYSSLLPVLVMLVFQVLPGLFKYELDNKGKSWMWITMLVSMVVISLSIKFY